jgi:hypothetical protein
MADDTPEPAPLPGPDDIVTVKVGKNHPLDDPANVVIDYGAAKAKREAEAAARAEADQKAQEGL